MLTTITIPDLKCDNCEALLSAEIDELITDGQVLLSAASDWYGWNIEDNKHLCPKCFDGEK